MRLLLAALLLAPPGEVPEKPERPKWHFLTFDFGVAYGTVNESNAEDRFNEPLIVTRHHVVAPTVAAQYGYGGRHARFFVGLQSDLPGFDVDSKHNTRLGYSRGGMDIGGRFGIEEFQIGPATGLWGFLWPEIGLSWAGAFRSKRRPRIEHGYWGRLTWGFLETGWVIVGVGYRLQIREPK